MMQTEALWYKDAIFYELHVRAFCDSNADGIGDFAGATQKLDYLHDLGITCIWLLPFYPSPLRDDGYDVSDYCQVHPDYGTLEDCRAFIAAAHQRNIRVIVDLVVNHTSDQHPWFQEARSSPHSPKRDYYVWSDTPEKYREARVIFKDFESSNWTWDATAGAYYWHRFFHHQPDLNYDNPQVRREMLNVVRFWLELGVDGFRCDAAPHLFEREGTNCENLPETHAYFQELRHEIDRTHPHCMLLAEANQHPTEVRAYFGNEDKVHMAFHFPLIPRLFIALRREDRQSIVEILAQTPPIPENCQWGVFLRNHDEMMLSHLTAAEREYLFREYATAPGTRLNTGIRRRLAPLLDNDQQRIILLHSLLLTLPGSPVLYYGDEIGMGDNLVLDDRFGLRTPMQWNSEHNAGFSQADHTQLYAPVIDDTIYGYQTVNVAAQLRTETSLLRRLQRLIAARKQHRAFGRGSLEVLHPFNQKVLAYIRQYEGETLLIVNNLSHAPQLVELDLGRFRGVTPVELISQTPFPAVDEHPYVLSLGPHHFYWLRLLPRA